MGEGKDSQPNRSREGSVQSCLLSDAKSVGPGEQSVGDSGMSRSCPGKQPHLCLPTRGPQACSVFPPLGEVSRPNKAVVLAKFLAQTAIPSKCQGCHLGPESPEAAGCPAADWATPLGNATEAHW